MNSSEGGDHYHKPVMVGEVLEWLCIRNGAVIVDATLGGGGHAAEMLKAASPKGRLIGIDRDRDAIAEASKRLLPFGAMAMVVRGRMSEIGNILDGMGIESADAILADLGVSSFQIDSGGRGFSFRSDAPLDMRMDRDGGESAAELLARLGEAEIEAIIREFGEERYSRRIARALAFGAIGTTGQLVKAVTAAVPPHARHGRINPATRTFQALRIAVNDELGELERFLSLASKRLGRNGRLAVISYHSLEDRMVKHSFRALSEGEGFSLPVRRAIRASEEEVALNPRARSAKLRVLERT